VRNVKCGHTSCRVGFAQDCTEYMSVVDRIRYVYIEKQEQLRRHLFLGIDTVLISIHAWQLQGRRKMLGDRGAG